MPFLDFLRWPLRTNKTHYDERERTEAQSSFKIKHFDTDSMGQLSGWVDRRLTETVLGTDKGPVDMQLPESFFEDRLQLSSISDPHAFGSWKPREQAILRASIKPEKATSFRQVFVWQPYERETSMPFSTMPTPY